MRPPAACILPAAQYDGGMIPADMCIEAVPPGQRAQALRRLLGARDAGELADTAAQAFEEILRSQGADAVQLWWARRGGSVKAAAVIVQSSGKTGFVYHTPLGLAGVHPEALAAVVASAARSALAGGLYLVQSLPLPDAKAEIRMLKASGFEHLAELIYMKLDLAGAVRCREAPELSWKQHGRFSEQELADVIAATYEGTRDCVRLCGVRPIPDVIASHRGSGVFCPESWWILFCGGVPAGCILVNDVSDSQASEVVYLGVTPAHRGKGLCATMLRRAAYCTQQRGRTTLTLAVDSKNKYARKAYKSAGFRRTHHRQAYVMIRPGCRGSGADVQRL